MRCLQYYLRYCILSALLILAPAVALGATCTFGSGVSTIGPINTETGVGSDCSPITADDTIVCGSGCVLSVTDDIILDGSGSNATCIQVTNGGSLTIDVSDHATAADTIGIETFEGCSVGSYGNVSLYVDSDSSLTIQGGWLQNGEDATPAIVTDDVGDNWTIWTIDEIDPCDSDCGSYPNLLCFDYSDARSNVDSGEIGESHIDHSIGAITAGEMQIRMLDLDSNGRVPPEWPRTYPIASVDSTGPAYSICIDTRELGWETGGYRTEALTGYTTTKRLIVSATTAAAASVGDTCINLTAPVLNGDGDYVGRWLRPDGESDSPYLIVHSTDGVDCDGGGTADAVYIPDETPIHTAISNGGDVTIDYGFARGQAYAVSAPVIISGSDNAGLSDADQKVVIEGIANLNGVEIHGAGELRFNGATLQTCKDIHTRDTGTDGYAAIAFEDVAGVTCSNISTMGGDGSTQGSTGQSSAVLFDDVTGAVTINGGSFRYFGDGGFITSGTTTTGAVIGKRLKFESILSDATNSGPLEFGSDDLARVSLSDVTMSDAVIGTSGHTVVAGDNPVYIDRLSVYGQADGSMGYGAGLKINNYYAYWVFSAITGVRTGLSNVLPSYVDNFETYHLRATAAIVGINTDESHVRNFLLYDVITAEDQNGIFQIGKGSNSYNGIIWDSDSSHANCIGGSTCNVVKGTFDGDTDTDDIFSHITIGWTPGNTTTFSGAWIEAAGIASEDKFTFGSIGIFNMDNAIKSSGTNYAFSGTGGFNTAMGDGTVVWDGPLCMQGNVATGGGTVEYHDAASAFLTAATADNLIRGYMHPSFEDMNNMDFSFARGSLAEQKSCGAMNGNQAPGVNRNVMQFGFGMMHAGNSWHMIISNSSVY